MMGLSPLILRAVHHHIARNRRNLRQRAQHFGVEVFEMREVAGLDAEQEFDRASDVMAFAHFRRARDRRHEGRFGFFCMPRQPDGYISDEANAHGLGIEHGAIALDDAGALQLLHPPEAGRGRHGYLLGQIGIADPPIGFQGLQYFAVDLV